MAIEQVPIHKDEEPRPMPGESDDAFRFRMRQWYDRKELELRQEPVDPEADKLNREMLERLRKGNFTDPHDQAAA